MIDYAKKKKNERQGNPNKIWIREIKNNLININQQWRVELYK